MRIGLDVMGGDFAPDVVIEGAVDVLPLFAEGDRLVLIGDLAIINNKLEDLGTDPSHFEIVHASQVIEMGDSPSKAFTHKPDSSIVVGYKLLADKEIDGFCSAGNTGAMLVGASHTVNVIPGVLRPALAALVPRLDGKRSILLDAGLNPDCKVDVLAQYGVLGTIFAKNVLGVENPTVKLLNIGSEESKGTPMVKAAYELMKDNPSINFGGNIEANELFAEGMAEVVVCDGFVGNIVLKETEAIYHLFKKKAANMNDPFFESFNFETVGGTPVIGINANVIIGHGVSKRKAIMNMIKQTCDVVRIDLAQKIKESV